MEQPKINQVLFITRKNIQSEVLLSHIESKVGLPINLVDYKVFDSHLMTDAFTMVMVDMSINDSLSPISSVIAKSSFRPVIVLINARAVTEEQLAQWRNLQGCFLTDHSLDFICDGLNHITQGQNWLSRDIMNRLVNYYQDLYLIRHPVDVECLELTKREVEILNSLKSGGSNLEIANELFVSENTVKTHLYNIFKKIEVKNRMQAISWAQEHI
ncbi:LuxR C-terminal-related transcriptional regulator [Vibrio hippocampi]|uniref:CsgAB operon transcriptional regulatory protein n=1 Tax=Vibrio hippocampi TaxID=654686 RepID=A0ABM8ZHM3_9VIBR|nr:LuxR C-terminal-related transcriptional regulator [Vibrio hippocampi]CAH0526166.1 putative csgAB operon transcriptional regulatory protein [Vibrio hippocampi]